MTDRPEAGGDGATGRPEDRRNELRPTVRETPPAPDRPVDPERAGPRTDLGGTPAGVRHEPGHPMPDDRTRSTTGMARNVGRDQWRAGRSRPRAASRDEDPAAPAVPTHAQREEGTTDPFGGGPGEGLDAGNRGEPPQR